MNRKRSLRQAHHVGTAFGGLALLGLAYFALRSVPELVRYIRIRKM
jgi:hypothetical protein